MESTGVWGAFLRVEYLGLGGGGGATSGLRVSHGAPEVRNSPEGLKPEALNPYDPIEEAP